MMYIESKFVLNKTGIFIFVYILNSDPPPVSNLGCFRTCKLVGAIQKSLPFPLFPFF